MRSMARDMIDEDTIMYNAAITACDKGEEWEKALPLVRRMARDMIDMNTITHSAAITACEKAKVRTKALALEQHGEGQHR